MEVFLASLAIFLLAVLGMSVGRIFGRRSLKGHCGGTHGQCGTTSGHVCQHPPGRECQHVHGLDSPGDTVE